MRTLWWEDGAVKMIDQRKLPTEFQIVTLKDYHAVAVAIRDMTVRGAPAIGAAAAFGLALAALQSESTDLDAMRDELSGAYQMLLATRPTAVNLKWAIDRMMRVARDSSVGSVSETKTRLLAEAVKIADEDVEVNRRIGFHGADLIRDGDTVLTHCNAGALATVDFGTALGVIRAAIEQGKRVSVFADETRPRSQGARLTAWELMRDEIPVTLIADNAAGHFMRKGRIDFVVVGADRVAANGDVCNKIGTYGVAVLARENGVPFYVAAPVSTIDLDTAAGDDIPIEERDSTEVTHVESVQVAPTGIRVANPAFDVTPHRYVTGIITENGIAYPSYHLSLRRMVESSKVPA